MIISTKLTAERLEEIKNHPISYDDDSPKLTKEQIARLKPAHEAYWNVTPVKKTISIKIDADILAVLQSGGKGYQTKINNPDASVGAQCSTFRTVCSIRWLQSALIPFVTTQASGY